MELCKEGNFTAPSQPQVRVFVPSSQRDLLLQLPHSAMHIPSIQLQESAHLQSHGQTHTTGPVLIPTSTGSETSCSSGSKQLKYPLKKKKKSPKTAIPVRAQRLLRISQSWHK